MILESALTHELNPIDEGYKTAVSASYPDGPVYRLKSQRSNKRNESIGNGAYRNIHASQLWEKKMSVSFEFGEKKRRQQCGQGRYIDKLRELNGKRSHIREGRNPTSSTRVNAPQMNGAGWSIQTKRK